MKNNGSPVPIFITDEDRIHFITRLKIHPEFTQAQDKAQDGAQVEDKILSALKNKEMSVSEILKNTDQKSRSGAFKTAMRRLLVKKS